MVAHLITLCYYCRNHQRFVASHRILLSFRLACPSMDRTRVLLLLSFSLIFSSTAASRRKFLPFNESSSTEDVHVVFRKDRRLTDDDINWGYAWYYKIFTYYIPLLLLFCVILFNIYLGIIQQRRHLITWRALPHLRSPPRGLYRLGLSPMKFHRIDTGLALPPPRIMTA